MSRLSVDSNADGNEDTTPSWAEGARNAVEDDEDEQLERTYSRRRSLECSAVVVSIVGTDATQGHTLYIIQVSSGIKQWEVARRYRDFCYLDKQLRKNFPKLKIPPLPSKTYLFSSTTQAVVDERRSQLETYLKTLIYMSSIWSRNDLALFLNNESNSMMFIWNFERMRKMQDMLSSMTVENESETTKLNTDLTLAKTQVQALQERLSRMEMLLLQQATGMASEELSPSAIRSLSGMGMERSLAAQLASELDEESAQLYEGRGSGASPARKGSVGAAESGATSYVVPRTEEEGLNPLDQAIIDDAIQAHVSSGAAMDPAEIVQVLSLTAQESTAQNKALLKNLKGKTPEQVRTLAVSLQLQEALRISNDVLNEKFDINTPDSARRSESHTNLTKLQGVKATPPAFPMSAAESVLFKHSPTAPDSSSSDAVEWVTTLHSEIEEIMQVLTPSEASIQARYKVFRYVRDLVSSTLAVQLFPVGATTTHTYLPDGDLDTSAFICKTDDDSWFVRVNEALCLSSFSQSGGHPGSKHSSFDTLPDPPDMIDLSTEEFAISNVGFVNGDVKKIKIMINNIAVDISMNQIGSLYSQYLIEAVDKFIGKSHLFKQSILLVEAWCRYESPRYTQGSGSIISTSTTTSISTATAASCRLSPWTVTVMLIWVFNLEGRNIHSPVQALGQFLRVFACFDWSKYALTVKGPVNAEDLSETEAFPGGERFFPTELLDKFYKVEEVNPPTVAVAAAEEQEEEESFMVGEVCVKVDKALKVTEDSTGTATTSGAPAVSTSATEKSPVEDALPATSTTTAKYNSAANAMGMVTERDAVYQQGLINIVDPAGPPHNLVAGLDVEGYQAVTSAFYEGYKQFQSTCEAFSKLSPARCSEAEVSKLMKQFLINTQLKVIGWNANFKKKPGNLSIAFGSSNPDLQQLAATVPANPNADRLEGQVKELEFSLRYAEIVLGGRICRRTLIQLIIRVLMHKGPMPVGEVGKNLQTMTGSENLSRRLKEQFSGLKKAMELSASPRVKVGSEHPFNPVVQLVPESEELVPGSEEEGLQQEEHIAPALGHHDYVFIPVLAAVAMAAREKEALAAAAQASSSNNSVSSGKSNRTFRRQPPFYVDNMSVSSRGTWNGKRGVPGRHKMSANSPRNGGGMYPNGSGPNSPMHAQFGHPIPMMMPAGVSAGVMPSPFPGMVAVPVGMPVGSPMQQSGIAMPMYNQQMHQQMQLHFMQQQQQIYQNYQNQMHPSMASSLSSSYSAAHSPMSHSPMGSYQAYAGAMMQAQQQYPSQQAATAEAQHGGSPKNADQRPFLGKN